MQLPGGSDSRPDHQLCYEGTSLLMTAPVPHCFLHRVHAGCIRFDPNVAAAHQYLGGDLPGRG